MGKNWFKAVKKALSLETKEKKHQKHSKSQNKLGLRDDTVLNASSFVETVSQELKLSKAESEETKHACVAEFLVAAAEASVASAEDGPEASIASADPGLSFASAKDGPEASVASADPGVAFATMEAVPEVVEPVNIKLDSNLSKEDLAAIRIQTSFRGYLARRALRALRGLVRLKTLLDGDFVKRQSETTLRCMQTLARTQSKVQAGRSRMSENLALQRQLLQKHENELDTEKVGENWDDSLQSKEQVVANLLHKQDAARRRERALAYAFSHQARKNSSRSTNVTFMDPNNPHWGWSWLERWTESQPSESQSTLDKELNNEQSSLKRRSRSVGGEITKAYTLREPIAERPSPIAKKLSCTSSHPSPFTPPSRTASLPFVSGNIKSASPRGAMQALDDDTSSTFSLKSEQYILPSISELSVGDEVILASTPAVPSYMAPTKSVKAKARLQSPLGIEQNETSERRSVGSAKKRLSFKETGSPKGPR